MLRTRLVAGATSGFVLSAVFATALTVVGYVDNMVEPWRVDPSRPAPITLRLPRSALGELDVRRADAVRGMVPRGHVVLDPELATLVRNYERVRRPPRPSRLAAQWLVFCLLVVTATTYFRRSRSKFGGLLRTQVGLLGLTLIFLVSCKAFLLYTHLPAVMLPLGCVPLMAAMLVDRRSGLTVGAVMALSAGALLDYDGLALVSFLVTTSVAVLSLRSRKLSYLMLISGLLGGLAGGIAVLAMKEVLHGVDLTYELSLRWRSDVAATLVAGVGAGVLAFILRPLVSALLGIVSRHQLMDLADLEQPLLKQMQTDAPGSWEHSRAMANLAEAAASSIGADALLTRVGAYYHDLGKSVQSKYFVENLEPGEQSPHDDLDPDVSADAIMAHVVEGVRILREGGVPEPVIEFSYTHHGTGLLEFFWNKCQEQGNPKDLSEDHFHYPGMRPRSRETAILMLIDAIEAGARTVEPPSREGFEALVRRTVFVKLHHGQLDDSGLSVEDLRVLTSQITDTLCNAYHTRIRYPWQDKEDKAGGEEPAAGEERERISGEEPVGDGSEGEVVEGLGGSATAASAEPPLR